MSLPVFVFFLFFSFFFFLYYFFFFQAEDGIRDLVRSRGLGDVYKRQPSTIDTMIKKSINWKDYALGWFVTGNDYWHTGGIQGTATVIKRNESHQINYAILFNTLPKDYTPFYNEFIHLVTNEFFQIKSWPKHDLFTPTNSINNSDDLNSTQIINNSNGFLSVNDFKGISDIVNYLGVKVWSGFIYPNQKINVNQFENGVYFFKTYNFSKKFVSVSYTHLTLPTSDLV